MPHKCVAIAEPRWALGELTLLPEPLARYEAGRAQPHSGKEKGGEGKRMRVEEGVEGKQWVGKGNNS